MKLLMTETWVPRGPFQWVIADGHVVCPADVLYLGPIKDPGSVVRARQELNELNEITRLRGGAKYISAETYHRRKELRAFLDAPPRMEVWRREFKVLGYATSAAEARTIARRALNKL